MEVLLEKIVILGGFAAANKSLTGGGYTPIAVGGQMLTGRTSPQSIGCTTISKAVVSVTATVLYLTLGRLAFNPIFLNLAIPLMIGAIIAAPIASYFAKRTEDWRMNRVVGVVIICLGFFTLLKTLLTPPS